MGTPEDIVDATLVLASDHAVWITSVILGVASGARTLCSTPVVLKESLSDAVGTRSGGGSVAVLDVDDLQRRLRAFADARDWEQFHSPKNLAMAVASEVGELVDVFQWLSAEESRHLSEENRKRAAEEIADVLIYVLMLGDKLGLDFQKVILEKMEANERKYPVNLARGNAVKYHRRS